ncbi:acetyltransferase (GNAT) family protein [Micromonospora endolithica]|nr:acetyltransferase (GNAT) family protein [Micromonospora endolithica]
MLGRLALDKTLQGQGLGSVLLVDALHRILDATKAVGARFVVVDAIDPNAAGFYARYGFTKIPETMRLVQKISAIQAAITGSPSSQSS